MTIGIIPQSEHYDSSKAYEKNAYVYDEATNSTYLSLVDNNTAPLTDTTAWGLNCDGSEVKGVTDDARSATKEATDAATAANTAAASYSASDRVVSESLAQLMARVRTIESMPSLGDASVGTLRIEDMPRYANELDGMQSEMMKVGSGSPTLYPMLTGQMYFDTASAALYVAEKVTMSLSDWVMVK